MGRFMGFAIYLHNFSSTSGFGAETAQLSPSVGNSVECSIGSSMPGEWQIAGRKGQRRATQHALQPPPQALISDDPQKQLCADTLNVAHERLLAFHSPEANAALLCLQKKIEACSKDVRNSTFLHNFQRLLKHLQHEHVMDSTSGQCKLQGTFAWEAAIDLVMYGLGSPAAGDGLLPLVSTASK